MQAVAQSVVLTEQMAAPLHEVPACPEACFPARPGKRTRKKKEIEDIRKNAKKWFLSYKNLTSISRTNHLYTCVCCLSCLKNCARASFSLDRCTRHMALCSLRAPSSDRRLYWRISSFLHQQPRHRHTNKTQTQTHTQKNKIMQEITVNQPVGFVQKYYDTDNTTQRCLLFLLLHEQVWSSNRAAFSSKNDCTRHILKTFLFFSVIFHTKGPEL